MKKIHLVIAILLSNLFLISCTAESLPELMTNPEELLATDGENEKTNPPEEPPAGDE